MRAELWTWRIHGNAVFDFRFGRFRSMEREGVVDRVLGNVSHVIHFAVTYWVFFFFFFFLFFPFPFFFLLIL